MALRRAHDIAQDAVGGSATFDPDDPEVRRLLDEAGERVTGIVEETRRRVRGYVAQGVVIVRAATRREVRRGMLTMLEAILAHIDELEKRLEKAEKDLRELRAAR